MAEHVFLTGATGCVGHYLVEALAEDPRFHLHLLVRDPARMRLPLSRMPNVEVVVGDFLDIERHAERLQRMDHLVHVAAAWGEAVSYEVNYRLAHRFFELADPRRVKGMVNFSTASVLGHENQLLPEADAHGTDYIKSKYQCARDLDHHPLGDRITTVFPTLIFGGSKRHPTSHLSHGLDDLPRWLWLLRHLQLEGSFHYIHARDIARIVRHVLVHGSQERRLALGNPAVTMREAIEVFATAHGEKPGLRVDLTPALPAIAALAGDRMNTWDRWSLTYRHFTYRTVNAATFGMPEDLATLESIVAERREARA